MLVTLVLRSNNGEEFTDGEFKEFCREVGIKRELSTPYNPQQNGVAERKNRSVMEAVQAMIHDLDLSMYLWAEVARTVVYVQNRSPHKVLENKTLEEVFSGKVPEVSHLRIFGCPVYIHIPKDKRTKFDPSGKKGIFFGYSETSKAYRVYVPGYKKVEISRDVIFDEDASFCKSKRNHVDEVHDEEPTASKVPDTEEEELVPENHDMMEPHKPVDSPTEVITYQRKPGWARELIQDA
jgi:hypothetical protein